MARARLQHANPWHPPAYTDAEAYAMQALARGEANESQQRAALDYIVNAICEYDGLSFRAGGTDGDRATAFAEGKRFVGAQIWKLIRINPAELAKQRKA